MKIFLSSKKNRMSLMAVGLAILMVGTALCRSSAYRHKTLMDPIAAEMDSAIAFDSLREKKAKYEASQNKYKLPPPIKYYKTGNASKEEFCTHNSQSEFCCSEERCATIVQRSTLYSECCANVHNNQTGSRSKVFPLLITSGPRSGTWFMQQLFTKTGLYGLTTDNHSPEHTGTVSWKHVFARDGYYFGDHSVTHLYRSKFRMIWHLVRDPLHALTSLAFTDPLWEDSDQSKVYMGYISSHIPITDKPTLMAKFNISEDDLEGVLEHRTHTEKRNPKLDNFLIWRGMEIYLYWHGFINYLHVPIFRIEDLAIEKNVTVLNEIFQSIGMDPPDKHKVLSVLDAQHRKRLRRQRQRKLLAARNRVLKALKNAQRGRRRLRQRKRKLQVAYQRTKRIRKGSRIHRPQLTWDELCAVSVKKAKAMLKMSHSFGYYMEDSVDGICEGME